jgi:DNA-directed RNA polymerase
LKESIFSSHAKALDTIGKETKTIGDQYKSKQSNTRRIDEEIEKRFANDPEAKVYMQHNVDTRGRTSPIDPSNASLNSGGTIRHGFTGSKKIMLLK